MQNTQKSSDYVYLPFNHMVIKRVKSSKRESTKPVVLGVFLQKPNQCGFELYHENQSGYSVIGQRVNEGFQK